MKQLSRKVELLFLCSSLKTESSFQSCEFAILKVLLLKKFILIFISKVFKPFLKVGVRFRRYE
ncbi:hypothetical protein AWW67_12030 [Roseivirga seohaensis]|uniref:Uncharacterized protein n=1 Tax=Roseivirga seohaensis TaxID=1914963 RepID=A0A150XMT8_9BACT|nr:hypothetical protein AWW67_12030 [Roseivirga seohaensis]